MDTKKILEKINIKPYRVQVQEKGFFGTQYKIVFKEDDCLIFSNLDAEDSHRLCAVLNGAYSMGVIDTSSII